VVQAVRLFKVRVVVGPTDVTAPAQVQNLIVIPESIERARLTWDAATDNYEVYRYQIFRDGGLIGYAYGDSYDDESVTPGQEYDYTVYAEDDAGNVSPVSATVTGGGAAIWGQDNFDDNAYTAADVSLDNCLTWTLLSGNVQGGNQAMRPGRASGTEAFIITDQSITPPFTMDFTNNQRYNTCDNGPMLLYLDQDNYYYFKINRDVFEFYRVMDGVQTLIASDPSLRLSVHAGSTARYQITVIAVDGVITFEVVRSEWTQSPDLITENLFYDDNPTAFQLFSGGSVGFRQSTLNTYNCATYDDLYLTRMDGVGPDLDGDGLIDAWERAYFGDSGAADANPNSDPDEDGMTTEDERLWGTNPASGGSRYAVNSGKSLTSDIAMSWPSLSGRVYTVWQSSDLRNWSIVPGMQNLTATPPNNTVDIELPEDAPLFFEIEVQAAP